MSLAEQLSSNKNTRRPRPRTPVWAGPESDAPNGGVTQSLLSHFLNCRERFRLLVVEGLKPADQFNHRIEYGSMWHVCEEELAGPKPTEWGESLKAYCRQLCRKYPTAQEQVDHWYNVCKVQFPLYVQYWSKHSDKSCRQPLEQEKPFCTWYKLPSGRAVYLRGKRDSVDVLTSVTEPGIYLQENKTKGDLDEQQIRRQMTFDLQTMLYLVALTQDTEVEAIEEAKRKYGKGKTPHEKSLSAVKGVRYNCIRRPLSGGKGTIKRHEVTAGAKCPKCKGVPGNRTCAKCGGAGRVGGKPAETKESFYNRVAQYIADEPEHYFMRLLVTVTPEDIRRFREQCLDPILEQLCQWWDWVSHNGHPDPWRDDIVEELGDGSTRPISVHWRHPFGVYNVLNEGGNSDLDGYLADGSEVGLERVSDLFPELA